MLVGDYTVCLFILKKVYKQNYLECCSKGCKSQKSAFFIGFNAILFLFVNFGNRNFRSSSPEVFCKSSSKVFCKKDVLKNFAKFTGNTCARASFLIKLQASLLKKRLWHLCFSVKFAKYLRTHFVIEQLRWLRLKLPS